MSDLSDLQPESRQIVATNEAIAAEARRLAAEEAQREHERFLEEQAATFITERAAHFDAAAREWATDAQGVTTDLATLAQQGQSGLITTDEFQRQFDRLNNEVARLRRQREDLVRQVEHLEEWETNPSENMERIMPQAMRRTL